VREARSLIIAAFVAAVTGIAPTLALAPTVEANSARLIAAYNGLGQRLFKELANKPGNVVFSPYSIGAATAMALSGARGATEVEMAKVLGLDLSRDQVNAANAAVLSSLNGTSSASMQLHLANALVLTNTQEPISKDYMASLQKNYAAEVFRGGNLATVNDWVKQKTDCKIDSILQQLDPATALVLVDAIYFKASWQRPFAEFPTDDATFHLSNGTTAKVPMMYQQADFALAQRQGYSAIRLPYEGARASMIVILPDAGIAGVMQRLTGEELQHLIASLRSTPEQPVELWLPRFKTKLQVNLVEPLKELGMHRAFDPQAADFSGLTGVPQSQASLDIDQIVHGAVIDVTEQGTEAAAATAESFATSAIEVAHWQPFRVDRPFLFAVVDDKTNAILFEGLIVDPR
jgi:serpin B